MFYLKAQTSYNLNSPGASLATRDSSQLLKFEQQKWITFEKRKTDQPDVQMTCLADKNKSSSQKAESQ